MMGSVNFEKKDDKENLHSDNGVGLYRRRFLWTLAGRGISAGVDFVGERDGVRQVGSIYGGIGERTGYGVL